MSLGHFFLLSIFEPDDAEHVSPVLRRRGGRQYIFIPVAQCGVCEVLGLIHKGKNRQIRFGYELTLESKDRISRFGLKGRGTDLRKVTCEQLEKQMANGTKGGMVAKIYWAEEARVSEKDILERVKKVAAEDNDVKGHVPVLLFAYEFSVSTSTIRIALGSKHAAAGFASSCSLSSNG
ncbi:hypothetical protein PAXINDRAFT_10219 [Paxillus involutus ATCC 200175]|nr:hypothetical protein PAXINDRAFT_10219 [Paxillus involutus ATCC 200175]